MTGAGNIGSTGLRRIRGGTVSHERRKDNFYYTPPECTRALLAAESFQGDMLEPACGNGAISLELEAAGHTVRSTDLVDRGYGESGLDFLLLAYPYRAANIVTNPPFNMAEEFLERALAHADRKVALLLKLDFLSGVKRSALLRRTPLAMVWVFERRITFVQPGRTSQSGGMITFAWYVWEHGHDGRPQVGWLS